MQLTAISGPLKARAWDIGPAELLIGRGRECDVHVSSPTVSRRQCCINKQGNLAHIFHLSRRVPTFLNGESVTSAELHAGDEIVVGDVVFLVTSTSTSSQVFPIQVAEGEISAITLNEAIFTVENVASNKVHPRFLEQLSSLYRLGRKMCDANSIAELNGILRTHMAELYSPDAFLVGQCGLDSKASGLDFQHDESASAHPTLSELMQEVVSTQRGVLRVGKRQKQATGNMVESLMAVPMMVRGQTIGVLGIKTRAVAPLTRDDLEYFIGVTHEAASIFMLIQLLEQRERDIGALRARLGESTALVGESRVMKALCLAIEKAAPTQLNVLIQGETGTGKELVAKMIHERSPRYAGPFVAVNCAAIPGELFESEFFGCEKGAFTGAHRQKLGHVELADRGSLFLDEVGDLSPANQARLLRVIEERTFRRVGGEKEISVDIRILAASNKDLPEAVALGCFRDDLLHRLNAFEITIPPLRERTDDIPVLTEHFLRLGAGQASRPVAGFAQEALEYLQSRAWPGNVRQLRNTVFRAIAIAQNERIGIEDVRLPREEAGSSENVEEMATLAEAEEAHIRAVLSRFNGNVSAAARALEVSRHRLYRKLDSYGILH